MLCRAGERLPRPCRKAGEFFGLLGPNGGGKSTLIHCTTGLARPTSGGIRIFGQDAIDHYQKARQSVGLAPHEGEQAGLRLKHDELVPLVLDFDDWLERGSGGPAGRPVIEHLLAERPGRPECFSVYQRDGHRVLELRVWLRRWER